MPPHVFTVWTGWMDGLAGRFFSPRWRQEQDDEASEELRRALRFTALGVAPHQVSISALVSAAIGFVLCLIWAFILIVPSSSDGETSMMSVILLAAFPLVLLPFIIAGWIANFPMILEKRQRTSTLGRLPEVTNYLAISMRLNPSLDRAVEFAAENSDEPMGSSLRKVLWDVYMRKYDTVEQSLLAFAEEWGSVREFEEFKRGIYGIRAAQLESTEEGREQVLDKATETVAQGARQHIEEYSNTLSAPAMVLFGLGVMLPLILGAMLPMASSMSSSGGLSLFEIALMFDVLFPVLTLSYSWFVVGRRPGTTPPPVIPDERSRRSRILAWAAAGLVSILFAAGGLFVWGGPSDESRYLAMVLFLGAIAYPLSIISLSGSISRMKHRSEILRIEDEFPDVLFQLGSRIAEGKPVEGAIRSVGESMGEASPTGKLLKKISHRILISSAPLYGCLFGTDGVLEGHASKTVKTSMRTVVDVSSKDSVTAGRTIMGVSNYIRDLRSVEQDVRMKLGETMSMMDTTSRFFAPLVLGVTCAMFFLVVDVTADIPVGAFSMDSGSLSGDMTESDFDFDGVPDSRDLCKDRGGQVDDDGCPLPPGIAPWQFLGIIGGYMLFLTVVISYFTSTIRSGEDWLDRRHSVGISLAVGFTVFALTAWASRLAIA